MTKFPDMGKWPKFPDIFSKFPDFSLTWRKFCFSLTRGNPVDSGWWQGPMPKCLMQKVEYAWGLPPKV